MRDKILAVIFLLIILTIPSVTIYRLVSATVKEKESESVVEVIPAERLLDVEQSVMPDLQVQEHEAQEVLPESEDIEAEEIVLVDGSAELEQEGEKQNLMDSIKEATGAVTDNLFLKEEAAQTNTAITSTITEDTYIESTQVLLGKENWLFYKNENDGKPLDDYRGTNYDTPEKLETIASSLLAQRDVFLGLGIQLVIMPIPNKEIIYAEYMPDTVVRKSTTTRLDIMVSYLEEHTDLQIAYPKEDLLTEKAFGLLYYKTDTHWNRKGSYVGLQNLLRTITGSYRSLQDVPFYTLKEDYSGDLAMLCNMQSKYCDDSFYALPSTSVDGAQVSPLKVVVVGDSFAENLVEVGNMYFTTMVYVPVYSFSMATLEEYQPDVVVWESVERYVDRYASVVLTDD